MVHRGRIYLAILILNLGGLSAARAQTDEIQVYNAEIAAPGVFNLTLHDNYTPNGRTLPEFPGAISANHTLNGVPEWAYGVTDWFEAGLYLPLYSLSGNGNLSYDGFKVRTLFVVPDAANRKFFYGVNFEFSWNTAHWDQRRNTQEIRPILGWHLGNVEVIVNPILDNSFQGFSRLDFAPATRVAYNLSKSWAVGAEEYDDFGPLRRFNSASHQQHQLFGVFDFKGKPWTVEGGGNPQLGANNARLQGYLALTFTGILFAPWIAVGALVRQRDSFAREQATAFALERSELERRALDARFRLLQAQVEPHFLFNTLANVQALVEAGAPQAAKVLKSLIAYLRAAVPRLHEAATTLGQELELVRAYLEVMHMRMPDRLKIQMHIDEALINLQCPPMTLLTLVENAVRHGIDPSETGGNIAIEARLLSSRCVASVTDTGVGLKAAGRGLGTGLASLRERLQLTFGAEAQLTLSEVVPHGVRADVSFPAREARA